MNRQQIRVGALVALVGAGVWACGSDGAGTVADAMVDAADILRDGASGLRDGASDDAAAQAMTFDVDCVEEAFTQTSASATDPTAYTRHQISYWRADVSIPGLDPARVTRAFAVVCGREVFGDPWVCPASTSTQTVTCEGSYPADSYDSLDCATTTVELEAGHVRAFCGNRSDLTINTATPPIHSLSGIVRRHARFVIETSP